MRKLIEGKYKKVVLSAITVFFIFSNFYFFTFYQVNQAKAMVITMDPGQLTLQSLWKGFDIAQLSLDEILNDLKATFFKNVVANLARSFAKASAKFIVSGAKGNKPFWETDPYGSIIDKGQAAFEDWLTSAVSNGIGLDLCEYDPKLVMNIALTLPNKPDKAVSDKNKEKSIIGGGTAKGCSFADLKDKFSTEGKVWQDFIKIKATEIGPSTTQNIQQISTDIQQNTMLRQTDPAAGQTNFVTNPPVLTNLNRETNTLGDMNNALNSDINKLIAKKGTNETVDLSVGSFPVSAEYIDEIKSAWNKKIDAAKKELRSQRAAYSSCRGKDIANLVVDPCATILVELGYPNPGLPFNEKQSPILSWFIHEAWAMPGATWIKDHPAEVAVLEREIQAKLENIDKTYNSLSIGYDSLSKFISQQIKPEMFESGSVYTWEKAKTQFEPQADPATATQQQVVEGTTKAQQKAEEREKTTLSTGGGWKGSVDKISNYIKTPADLLKAKSIESLSRTDTAVTYTKSIVADSLGVFLQELYNLYTQQMLLALSNPKKQQSSNKSKGINAKSSEEQGVVTEEGVSLYYENLGKDFNFTLPDLALLQEFQTTISAQKINPNIYNNVIDLNFAMAIDQRLTIREAISSGKLNPSLTFSWSETLEPNTLNLSNLRKLRKARVIPLGLELAAELIRDCNTLDSVTGLVYTQRYENCLDSAGALMTVSNDTTLSAVVEGFENSTSPFYKLVDPDWVLKLPATKCMQSNKNEVYGEVLRDNDSGARYSRCADFASCLKNDFKNDCKSATYGVCVKEQNVWRIGGDTCSDKYDSCTAYSTTDSKGKTNKVAYLKSTLDPAGCGPDTIGCKGYTRSYDNPRKFYFNNNVQTCDINNDGCHEFISDPATLNNYPALPADYDAAVLATRVYYKINPSCDANPAGADCGNFMTKCADSEVGCASYKPLNGEPTVTAVIQTDDQCPGECVGFSAFVRQATNFEPNNELAYFVPNTARTCSAASVGCSQFTNLDLVAQGGEGIEYYTNLRQCIKPGSGLGEKTFFTWQSTPDGSQQVTTHILQDDRFLNDQLDPNPAATGAPKTFDGSGDCDPNADYCLTFYDSAGKTFLRDIRKTILVSDDCHPYRKTVSSEGVCRITNGVWASGNCIYNGQAAISQEFKCEAAEANCYNYLGAAGRNIFTLIADDFESDSILPETNLPAGYQTGTGASVISGSPVGAGTGSSLKIPALSSAIKAVSISGSKYYILEFWAKSSIGSGTLSIPNFGDITFQNTDWSHQIIGPVKVDYNLSTFTFINQTGGDIYIDSVNLTQHKSNYYLIKDSWTTPPCSYEDLNCEAYTGPKDQTFYLKSFFSLCSEDKVGCQYLVDTRNSLSPQAKEYSGELVSPDQKAAYVVNSRYKCTSEFKGCEKFIEPVFATGQGISYETTYLINDPENYAGPRGILCKAEAENCTELINENGSSEYYKIDPTKICQYVQNGSLLTWYLSGVASSTICPQNSDIGNLYKVSDTAKYTGYTGACPLAMSGCSGFETVKQDNSSGQTYYIIDNENNIDRSSCKGVDWNKGCVVFKNTATNEVNTIKVEKDRDCAEWVDCAQKDGLGNCVKMAAYYTDSSGYTQISKLITSDAARPGKSGMIEINALRDKVRYAEAGFPLIINRKTYVNRFTDSADRWDKGDYSGYSIPDRYPLEVEICTGDCVAGVIKGLAGTWEGDPLDLESIKYGFQTYSKEVDISNDPRFTIPICKVFATEDAPVPYEVTRKMGFSKIQNLYSQSVPAVEDINICSYEQVEVEGTTAYFPYNYLSKVFTEGNPYLCTGVTSLNGKICTTPGAADPLCKVEGKYATCTAVESSKINVGIPGRCLEMDLLNPLYGNVLPGSYACLSYFPFQYDECTPLSGNQLECEKLPYCSYLNGSCVGDICQFKKDMQSCEDFTVGDPPVKQCLWDGGANGGTGTCLFRVCSLAGIKASNESSCKALAPYCNWWSNRCTEDICSNSYSLLGNPVLESHLEPQTDLCMNPGDGGEPPLSPSNGKGEYCGWQMRHQANSNKHGRFEFSCQLQCSLKYPWDPTAKNKKSCTDDPYCSWSTATCQDICANRTEQTCTSGEICSSCTIGSAGCGADGTICTTDSNIPARCAWDGSQCVEKCKSFNTQPAAGSTTETSCTDNAAIGCVLSTGKCVDICATFNDSNVSNNTAQKSSCNATTGCEWSSHTGGQCKNGCRAASHYRPTCVGARDAANNSLCVWGGTPDCRERKACDTISTVSGCNNLRAQGCVWQGETGAPRCYNPAYESSAGVSTGLCNVGASCTDLTHCYVNTGYCQTAFNVAGCQSHDYNADLVKSGNQLAIRADASACETQTNGACAVVHYNESPKGNFWCFPSANNLMCYEDNCFVSQVNAYHVGATDCSSSNGIPCP